MLFYAFLKSSESLMEFPLMDCEFDEELYGSGQEVQRLSVLNCLPELLAENYDMCIRRIIPKVREVVRVAAVDTQKVAGAVFLEILQGKLVPMQTYSQTFLPTILLSMDNKDPELSGAWLETLLAVMELLPKEIISKEVLYRAVAKGQLSQPVPSRLASCQILAKAATKLSSFEVKRDILSIVLSLCQDVEYEVRACMSRLLCPVARALGTDETKTAILPELVELTKDEKIEVRLAGLDTLVSILPLLDDEAKISTVIPIFSNYCSQALEEKDSTLSAIAQYFGSLCEALQGNFTDEQKKEFLDMYKKLCKISLSKKMVSEKQENKQPRSSFPILTMFDFDEQRDEEEDEFERCRQHAAFNLPTMISFVGPKLFKTELSVTLAQLCTDNNVHVREKVATRFHEIAKLVGSSSHSAVADSFIKLLQDNQFEVLNSGLIQELPETLAALSKAPNCEAKMLDVLTTFSSRRDFILLSKNWRLQEQYFTKLSCLPSYFTSDQIYQHIILPLYPKLRTLRALPVRRAFTRTLLILLRHNSRQEQREKTLQSFLKDYGRGQSCFQRSLFIDACWMVLELYSRSFFKEWFFRPLINLHKDKVPNVRLRVCAILPRLKSALKRPTDEPLIQLLDECIQDLHENETDRDAKQAVVKASAELGEILIPFESHIIKTEEDKADDKKLNEEKEMLEEEQRQQNKKHGGDVSCETKKKLAAVAPMGRGSKLPTPTKTKDKPATSNYSSSVPSNSTAKDPKKPAGTPIKSSASLAGVPSPSPATAAVVRRVTSGTIINSASNPATRGRNSVGTVDNKKPANSATRRTSIDNSNSEIARKK